MEFCEPWMVRGIGQSHSSLLVGVEQPLDVPPRDIGRTHRLRSGDRGNDPRDAPAIPGDPPDSDKQAAIRASISRKAGAGRHLLDEFHRIKRAVKRAHGGMMLTMRWVSRHERVEGNVKVDEEAREAAQGHSSVRAHLPKFLHKELLRSAAKLGQERARQLAERAEKGWKNSPRHRRMTRLVPLAKPSVRQSQGANRLQTITLMTLLSRTCTLTALFRYIHDTGWFIGDSHMLKKIRSAQDRERRNGQITQTSAIAHGLHR